MVTYTFVKFTVNGVDYARAKLGVPDKVTV